jgi:hypothetical protein
MMSKNFSLFAVLMIVLSSCAGIQTVSKYDGIAAISVDVDGKCFSVYPYIANNTIYVNECPFASAGKSYIEGLTFGLVDTTPPKESHEKAALNYLESTKQDCEIIYPNTYYISDSLGGSYGYEISVNCTFS